MGLAPTDSPVASELSRSSSARSFNDFSKQPTLSSQTESSPQNSSVANESKLTKSEHGKLRDLPPNELAQIISIQSFSADFNAWLIRTGQIQRNSNLAPTTALLKSLSGMQSAHIEELLNSFSQSAAGNKHKADLSRLSDVLTSKEFEEIRRLISDKSSAGGSSSKESALLLLSNPDPQSTIQILNNPEFRSFQQQLQANFQIDPNRDLSLVIEKFKSPKDREFLNSELAKFTYSEGDSLLLGRQGKTLAGAYLLFEVAKVSPKSEQLESGTTLSLADIKTPKIDKEDVLANRSQTQTKTLQPNGNNDKSNIQLVDDKLQQKRQDNRREGDTSAKASPINSLNFEKLFKLVSTSSSNSQEPSTIAESFKAKLEEFLNENEGSLLGGKKDEKYNPLDSEQRFKRFEELSKRITTFEQAFGLQVQNEEAIRSIAKLGEKQIGEINSLGGSELLKQVERNLGKSVYDASVNDLLNPEKSILFSALGLKKISETGLNDKQWTLLKRFANAFGVSLGEVSLDRMNMSFKQLERLLEEPGFQQLAANHKAEIQENLIDGKKVSLSLLSKLAAPNPLMQLLDRNITG